jgi:3-hydroxyacyl-CoA dehydrogenase
MSSLVQFSIDGDVAILTINNPPVNALNAEERDAIRAAVQQADNDPRVKAMVIMGAGRVFIAGGDINDFVKITLGLAQRVPALLRLIEWIEDRSKPVVAAINGLALGGGLELAMGAHYRLATLGSQVGQPEVKLGLIPGGGGTQRLPRLVGVQKAVQLCTEGNPIKVEEAIQLGLIDKLMEGDLLAGAVAFARGAIGKPIPKTRERDEKLGAQQGNNAIFAAAREEVRMKQRAPRAALAAIDAIEAATKLSFTDGCEVEQKQLPVFRRV